MSTQLDWLSGPFLTEIAQSPKIRRGTPRALPAELWTPSPHNKPTNDKVEYTQFNGNRAGAKLVSRMSPARATQIAGAERKFATGVSTKELFTIDNDLQDLLKSANAETVARGKRELIRRVAEFMSRSEISRTNVVASIFATGKLFWDADGNILANSTGAAGSIDFKVPLANQLAPTASGGDTGKTAIGDWSNASSPIRASLKGLKTSNLRKNNYPLTTVLYGSNVPDYLSANSGVKEYFARHERYRDAIVDTGEIAQGTLGFKWVPVETMYHVLTDAAGNETVTEWFGADFIGVMPDVSDDWWEFVECGSNVPVALASIGQSLQAAMDNLKVVNGPYSYVESSTNPVAVNQIVGDAFLGLLKVPTTYYFGRCK